MKPIYFSINSNSSKNNKFNDFYYFFFLITIKIKKKKIKILFFYFYFYFFSFDYIVFFKNFSCILKNFINVFACINLFNYSPVLLDNRLCFCFKGFKSLFYCFGIIINTTTCLSSSKQSFLHYFHRAFK